VQWPDKSAAIGIRLNVPTRCAAAEGVHAQPQKEAA